MRFKSVKLENYAQHKNLDIKITGNVVALVGKNGSGKSNFLLALKDGLTGEFSRNKDRLVTWGQSSGSKEFELEFGDGRKAVLRRELPSGKASLTIGDNPPVKGASKVNEVILSELGVDKTILMNVVFVGQREIESLLFSSNSAAKDRLAQKFFGIEVANGLESAIAKKINTIVFDSGDCDLPSWRDRLKQMKNDLISLDEQIAGLQVSETASSDIEILENRVIMAAKLAHDITEYQATTVRIDKLTDHLNALNTDYKSKYDTFATIDPQRIDELYRTAMADSDKNKRHTVLTTMLQNTRRLLAGLVQPAYSSAQIDVMEQTLAPLLSEMESISNQMRQQRSLIQGMLDRPVCPTCHQKVDLSQRDQIQATIDQLTQRAAILEGQIGNQKAALDSARREYSLWDKNKSTYDSLIEQHTKSLLELGDRVSPEPDPEKIIAMRRSYDLLSSNLSSTHAEIQRSTEEQAVLLNKRNSLSADVLDSTGNVKTQEDVTLLRGQIADLRAASERLQRLVMERNYKSADITSTERTIEKLSGIEKQNRIAQKYQHALSRLREVFHPDGAPKILVSRRAKKLEHRINQFLEILDTPFRVEAGEGMEFTYKFAHGLAAGEDLSVGQQVDMSWAFRLAACETFSSSAGLMTMDEPTAPLDQETKQRFAELIERLIAMADTYRMQFFISTHDPELVRACDQVIQF